MLASFDKMGFPPMENLGEVQEGSDKPVRKTTSKTEVRETIHLPNNF